MTYAEKLKDPRWQKKRLEILERDSFLCRGCGDGETTLHVDHKVYRRGADPWDYSDDDLQTLCETCHERITEARKRISDAVGQMNVWELNQLEVFIRNRPFDEVFVMLPNPNTCDGDCFLVPEKKWERIMDIVKEYADRKDAQAKVNAE